MTPRTAKAAGEAQAAPAKRAEAKTSVPIVVMLRGSALPPSPFELGCSATRLKVQYDQRNMAGLSAVGLASVSGAPPDELARLICQFVHEGANYPLQAVPLLVGDGLRGLAKVQREGLLKAAADVSRELARGTPEPIHWWLALRFALQGYVPRADYVRVTLALNTPFSTMPLVEQRNDLLLWMPFIERKGTELTERLLKERERNPFLDRITVAQVSRWLAIDRGLLATIVMRRVAERMKTAVMEEFHGLVLRLPPGEQLPAAKQSVADEVLHLFESGAGMPLDKLQERSPKFKPVVAQLIEAGRLVETASGFVFTDRQVHDWLTKLKLRNDAPVPGVGDLKKVLGLPRKDAEELRALLLASGGQPHE